MADLVHHVWVHTTLYAAGSVRYSIRATLAPLCANSRAAVQPAMLLPTTATSNSLPEFTIGSLLWLTDQMQLVDTALAGGSGGRSPPRTRT